MLAFVNVMLVFAILYVAFGHHYDPVVRYPDAIYFSVTTAATIGGHAKPKDFTGQLVMVVQLLTTMYFVAVLLAIFVGWAPERRAGRPL